MTDDELVDVEIVFKLDADLPVVYTMTVADRDRLIKDFCSTAKSEQNTERKKSYPVRKGEESRMLALRLDDIHWIG